MFQRAPQAPPEALIKSHTLVTSSADRAVQNRICVSSGFTQQIAAIRAENQRPNDRHVVDVKTNEKIQRLKDFPFKMAQQQAVEDAPRWLGLF